MVGYQRGKDYEVLVNMSEERQRLPCAKAKILVSNYSEQHEVDQNLELKPYEAVLIKKVEE